MAFIAKTDIWPGDQLLSSYGRQYFINMGRQCVCTDWDQNGASHLPPTTGELEVAGRNLAPVPDVIDTLANLRELRDVNTAKSASTTAFNGSRTFEIDVSAGGNFVTTREFTIPRSALMATGASKMIDIDLVLRRRGARGGGVTKPVAVTGTRPAMTAKPADGTKPAAVAGPRPATATKPAGDTKPTAITGMRPAMAKRPDDGTKSNAVTGARPAVATKPAGGTNTRLRARGRGNKR